MNSEAGEPLSVAGVEDLDGRARFEHRPLAEVPVGPFEDGFFGEDGGVIGVVGGDDVGDIQLAEQDGHREVPGWKMPLTT